jgi:hypothetical protein
MRMYLVNVKKVTMTMDLKPNAKNVEITVRNVLVEDVKNV